MSSKKKNKRKIFHLTIGFLFNYIKNFKRLMTYSPEVSLIKTISKTSRINFFLNYIRASDSILKYFNFLKLIVF